MIYKFNLNDTIKVRINPEGFMYWKERDDEIFNRFDNTKNLKRPIESYTQRADSDGYVGFQAWHFIEIFGSSISMSSKQVFDLNILIDSRVLAPTTK